MNGNNLLIFMALGLLLALAWASANMSGYAILSHGKRRNLLAVAAAITAMLAFTIIYSLHVCGLLN